jgi:myo-inositol-1(or 4)-monophosphatase
MDLASLTAKVCRIAMDAGSFLKEERKTFRSESVEKKHAHDYVSYVDKESEKQIVAELSVLLPKPVLLRKKVRQCIRMNLIVG